MNKRNLNLSFMLAVAVAAAAACFTTHAKACNGPQPAEPYESAYAHMPGQLGCMIEAPAVYDLFEPNGKKAGSRAVFEHGEIATSPKLSPLGGTFVGYVDQAGLHVKFDGYTNAPAYEVGVGQWGDTSRYQYKLVGTPGTGAADGSVSFPLDVIGTDDAFVRLVRCPKQGTGQACNPEALDQVAEIHIKRSMIPSAPASTAQAERKYSIDIESVRANIPRTGVIVDGSHQKRADHLTSYLSIKVGNAPVVTAPAWGPQWIAGNGDAETKQVNQSLQNIVIKDGDVVRIAYSVVTNATQPQDLVNQQVEKEVGKLASIGIDVDIDQIKDFSGVNLSGLSQNEKDALGGAQLVNVLSAGAVSGGVLLVGAAVGYFSVAAADAVTGWFKTVPICDGPVAGSVLITSGKDLRKLVPYRDFVRRTDHQTNTNQKDCGHDSDYEVTWHIHAIE